MKLVLASTSPYRRELLARLGVPFEVAAPEVDETPLSGESPDETAQRLSLLKARAVAEKFPDALIIGSDQVALLEGVQLGKPGTHEKAIAQLKSMRGKALEFHTALTLLNARSGSVQTANVPVRLVMREYTDAQIENYLLRDQPYNCCGSARSESLGIALIARFETEDPNALIGLPLIKLTEMLANEGMDVLA
ncbi:MAG: septum formation inhibitor Maf [Hydrogenophilales bacterium CG17_big_fil_post_rev_8_21_14_2_50_63_12]|nr:MAG: septum formation inhibitor Maf [Hydrogenophilales bacterium CG17_big_fil_post_rev_8_21_14_2_50_63_12]PIX97243.1 MAG: septum formation inhibitor Maf [Hydrogenophilales bacterium CG_4_10_14_3_um_filter_63_21]PJB06851.1 MAG: septum formation inhibitor Maf [Hydrogenophilales bacterium CG_4_9_14_3_um_filter_63_34]